MFNDSKRILMLVIRHGRTDMNEENIFRGNSNPPLDKDGYKDANRVAHFLEAFDFSYVFTSPKQRSAETARIICQNRECKPIEVDGLVPWDVGDFGGLEKTKENINALQYYIKNPSITVPGGSSLNGFKARVSPLLLDGIDIAMDQENPIALIIHSSVIHEVGELFGRHHEAAHVKPGGVAAVFIENGKLDVEPIFLADERASTQNILGVKRQRSGLSS